MSRGARWTIFTAVCSALILLGFASLRSLLDPSDDPQPATAPPAVSSDPNGSVATFEVNGRTVSCAVIDPPGEAVAMSCDWTKEAS